MRKIIALKKLTKILIEAHTLPANVTAEEDSFRKWRQKANNTVKEIFDDRSIQVNFCEIQYGFDRSYRLTENESFKRQCAEGLKEAINQLNFLINEIDKPFIQLKDFKANFSFILNIFQATIILIFIIDHFDNFSNPYNYLYLFIPFMVIILIKVKLKDNISKIYYKILEIFYDKWDDYKYRKEYRDN
ncbi:MAG: hypothetical protein NT007_06870 [Candidatus Kapabacteria bacterium]|nr:hypothetical protein [Candidatus Kapabacteria bacterium]